MTIFVSLVMLLVASVLFTLLEAARVPGLDAKAVMMRCCRSSRRLRSIRKRSGDQYDLLVLDLGYGEQLLVLRN